MFLNGGELDVPLDSRLGPRVSSRKELTARFAALERDASASEMMEPGVGGIYVVKNPKVKLQSYVRTRVEYAFEWEEEEEGQDWWQPHNEPHRRQIRFD